MPQIITCTPNPALDLSTSTDKFIPEEKLRCAKPLREPGGGGINVARALKRLCCDATAIFPSGGPTGEMYESLLAKEKIDQHPLKVKSATRESIMITDKEHNDLYRFILPGGELEEREWQMLLDLVNDYADADYLIASGSLPPGAPENFYARLSRKAREHNVRFILDTSGTALCKITEAGAFLLKPNKNELAALVGRKLTNESDWKNAAEEVINKYDIEVLVVSLGGEGAILATSRNIEKLAAPQVEKQSSVGAGDSMVAGIVSKLIEGMEIREAVRYGLCCGSAAIMTPGSELLHKKDADELFEKIRSENPD
ncbi:MAG: 1-phosphofructokinase family hexose kinase [Bacteroidia bacterium]